MAALSSPYRAIIFDLDGTLIDSSPSILGTFDLITRHAGITPVVPLTSALIGPPLRKTLATLTGLADETALDALVTAFKEIYDSEGYKATAVYGGIRELLAVLHEAGIPLAIATNKRLAPTLKILEYFSWSGYFTTVGALDSSVPPYPDKATLLKSILGEMRLDPATTLYVGDKPDDASAAFANNMPFAAVAWGYGDWNGLNFDREWRLVRTAEELRSEVNINSSGLEYL